MVLLVVLSLLGLICMIPIHFWSLEHGKLAGRFGEINGRKIGELFGMVSGWGFFLFSAGLWFSPQPRVEHPFNVSLQVQILDSVYRFSPIYVLVAVGLLAPSIFFGVNGVREVSLKVSETHRPEKVITSGVYSKVRHPQYFAGILSHLGVSLLLSAYFALLVSPVVIVLYVLLSLKEERELIKEFGEEYVEYTKKVPMIFPRVPARDEPMSEI